MKKIYLFFGLMICSWFLFTFEAFADDVITIDHDIINGTDISEFTSGGPQDLAWKYSSLPGKSDGNGGSLYVNGDPGSWCQWTPSADDLDNNSVYEVFFFNVRRTGGYDKNLQLDIAHNDGTATIFIDQQTASGENSGWISLGSYRFAGRTTGSEYVKLIRMASGSGVYTQADAVKFVKIVTPPTEYAVISNLKYLLDGEDITEQKTLPTSGNVRVTSNIKNNTGAPMNITLIVTLCSSSGKVFASGQQQKQVERDAIEPFEADFIIPDNVPANSNIELFIWDSVDDMHPLADPKAFLQSAQETQNLAVSSVEVSDLFNVTCNGDFVDITGKNTSGKRVTVLIKDSNGNYNYINQTIVDSNENYSFAYTLDPEIDVGGIYEAKMGGDGINSPLAEDFYFVDITEKNAVITQINLANSVQELENLVRKYYLVLELETNQYDDDIYDIVLYIRENVNNHEYKNLSEISDAFNEAILVMNSKNASEDAIIDILEENELQIGIDCKEGSDYSKLTSNKQEDFRNSFAARNDYKTIQELKTAYKQEIIIPLVNNMISKLEVEPILSEYGDLLNLRDYTTLSEKSKAEVREAIFIAAVDGVIDEIDDINYAISKAIEKIKNEKPHKETRSGGSSVTRGVTVSAPVTLPIPTAAQLADETAANAVVICLMNTKAIVRGISKTLDVPAYIKNNRTLVSVRLIGEAFGAAVDWNEASQTAILTTIDNRVISIVIGDSKIVINGQSKNLDVPAEIQSGRTMLPLRAVAETLGKEVLWDDSNQLIIISDAKLTLDKDVISAISDKLK